MNLAGEDYEYIGNVIAFPCFSSADYLVARRDDGRLTLFYLNTDHSDAKRPVTIAKLTDKNRIGAGAVALNPKNSLSLYRTGVNVPGDQGAILFSRSIKITNTTKKNEILDKAKAEISEVQAWDELDVVRAGWGSVLSSGVKVDLENQVSSGILSKLCPYEIGLGRVQLSVGEIKRIPGIGFTEMPYPLIWFNKPGEKPAYYEECSALFKNYVELIKRSSDSIAKNNSVEAMLIKEQLLELKAQMVKIASENKFIRAHADLYFPELASTLDGSTEQFKAILKNIDGMFTRNGCYGSCHLRVTSLEEKVIASADVFLSAEYRAKKKSVDLLQAKGSLFLKYGTGNEMLEAIKAGKAKVEVIPVKRTSIVPATKDLLINNAINNLRAYDSGSLVPQDDKGLAYVALSKTNIQGNELVTRAYKISKTLTSTMKIPLNSKDLIKGEISLANEALLCILRADKIAEAQPKLNNDLNVNVKNANSMNENLTFS